jgi:hypothetical protein
MDDFSSLVCMLFRNENLLMGTEVSRTGLVRVQPMGVPFLPDVNRRQNRELPSRPLIGGMTMLDFSSNDAPLLSHKSCQ